MQLSVTPLRDQQGTITGFVGIGSDITERKRAEAERARLLASEQEKAEQLRLSVREAHHRIKNNLQAISDLLYLELSSKTSSTPEEALRESLVLLDIAADLDAATGGFAKVLPVAKAITADGIQDIGQEQMREIVAGFSGNR